MVRIIALLLLVLPGALAAFGIKLMRDMVFGIAISPFTTAFLWVQFLAGLLFFIIGVGFIAGFILHRDRKRNRVQARFQVEKSEKIK